MGETLSRYTHEVYITPKFTKEVTKFGELEVKGHIRLLNMGTSWEL